MTLKFPPTPNEDPVNGKNSNAYLALKSATHAEKLAFIGKYAQDVQMIALSKGLPASAVLAMMALESGYGFTRTAYLANNFFGAKNWGGKWKSRYSQAVYQLKGQPDEGEAEIIETLPTGQVLYNEDKRPDNLYFSLPTPQDCIKLFVNEWICEGTFVKKYMEMPKLYQENRKKMNRRDAAMQFLYDIAARGYCHLGGDYYRATVGNILDFHRLDLLD